MSFILSSSTLLALTPMDQEIGRTLELASSDSSPLRHDGESRLKILEKTPGFYTSLLNIYASPETYPFTIRWLSVIHLKNTIDGAWRRPHTYGLSPDEKKKIRNALFHLQTNPAEDSRLHSQLAMVVSRVAKQDFPRHWPNLLDFLSSSIKQSAAQGLTANVRALLETTYRVIKTLAHVKIGLSRKSLNEWGISDNGIGLIQSVYSHFINESETLDLAYTSLKLMGILLYDGNDRAHRYESSRAAFARLLPDLKGLMTAVQSQISHKDVAEKLIVRISKIYVRMFEKCPLVVCNMPTTDGVLAFFLDYLVSPPENARGGGLSGSGEGLFFEEKLAMQGMHLLREAAHLQPGTHASVLPLNLRTRDEQDKVDLKAVYALAASTFFTEGIVALTDSLLVNFFAMRDADVELWLSDPAEYFFEEASASYDYNVSYGAEMLFGHLLKDYPEAVTPRAQGFIEECMVDPQNFLRVESALKALEFGAMSFHDVVNLEQMLPSLMALSHPFIRRRLCLLTAAWVTVTSSETLHSVAYELALESLSKYDLVVQLAALKLIRACADDLSFSPEAFNKSVAGPVFDKMFDLLCPEYSTEVKLHVLEVLGVLVESLRGNLSSSRITHILEILPRVWESETTDSKDHALQTTVLQALASLAYATGPESIAMWPITFHMLNVASDPSQPIFTYLEEEALLLWQALIANAPNEGPLGALFDRLIDLLESRTESLSILLKILEGYFLISPTFALAQPLRIANLLALYINECSQEETSTLALLLRAVSLFASRSSPDLPVILAQTDLTKSVAQRVLAGNNPEANLLQRVSGAQAAVTLGAIAMQVPTSVGSLSIANLSALMATSNAVSDPLDRKMVCLGCTKLLFVIPELFLQLSAQYLNLWAATLDEIPDISPDQLSAGILADDFDDITMEKRREMKYHRESETANTPLRAAIGLAVQQLRAKDPAYETLLSNSEF